VVVVFAATDNCVVALTRARDYTILMLCNRQCCQVKFRRMLFTIPIIQTFRIVVSSGKRSAFVRVVEICIRVLCVCARVLLSFLT